MRLFRVVLEKRRYGSIDVEAENEEAAKEDAIRSLKHANWSEEVDTQSRFLVRLDADNGSGWIAGWKAPIQCALLGLVVARSMASRNEAAAKEFLAQLLREWTERPQSRD